MFPQTPTQSSPFPRAQNLRRTVHNLVSKIKPPKEETMPGELDPTDVQLARFFGKPPIAVAVASSPSLSPTNSKEDASTSSSSSSLSSSSSRTTTSLASPSFGPTNNIIARDSRISSDMDIAASEITTRTAAARFEERAMIAEGVQEMVLEIRPREGRRYLRRRTAVPGARSG